MSGRPPSRPQGRWSRAALLLAVAVAALPLAGCAGQAAESGTERSGQSGQPGFDPALHSKLPDGVRDAGVVTVATDASYAPANFFAPDGRSVIGFEPDLAKALGKLLGVRFEFVVTDFVDALDDVEAGLTDVVISAMTDTAERQQQADFVNYFSAGTAILVQRGNPHGIVELGDLCGQVVAVERGTVQVDLLHRTQANCTDRRIDVRTYPTNSDALVQLRTGRAAAVLNDYPPSAYLTTDPQTQDYYQLASNIQYEPGLYGVAVAKDRPRLREALQAALERLVSSGTYAEILAEWDVSDGAVSRVTVNAG